MFPEKFPETFPYIFSPVNIRTFFYALKQDAIAG